MTDHDETLDEALQRAREVAPQSPRPLVMAGQRARARLAGDARHQPADRGDEHDRALAGAVHRQRARRHAVPTIRTDNASTNRPMLSINEALGFARQPAWISFLNKLREE